MGMRGRAEVAQVRLQSLTWGRSHVQGSFCSGGVVRPLGCIPKDPELWQGYPHPAPDKRASYLHSQR